VEVKRVVEAEAAERVEAAECAAHWASEMDNALAYRRDVHRQEPANRLETRQGLVRHRIMRRQEAAIRDAIAAIGAADAAGNGDGGVLH
jgi:hypothetical protein